MTIPLHMLPDDRRETLIAAGKVHQGILHIDRQKFERISSSKAPVKVQKKSWPLWARLIAKMKSDSDQGIGDTVERTVGPIGGAAFKSWAKSFGIDCGCGARREDWNRRFPYALTDGSSAPEPASVRR